MLGGTVPGWAVRVALWGLLIVAVAGWVSSYLASREARQAAEEQGRLLLEAGWQRGRVVDADELPGIAPDVEAPPEAADTPTVAGIRVRTREVPVYITQKTECPSPVAHPSPGEVTGGSPASSRPAAPDFTMSGDLQALATADEAGRFYLSGIFDAHLRGPDWQQTVSLPLDPEGTQFAVSEELRDAWSAWRARPPRISFRPRRPHQWRVGWNAGVGVCFSDGITPCAYVGLGVQF